METERMFVAVLLPENVRDHLDTLVAPRREADGPWRWSDPALWHLTLAFAPEVETWRLDEFNERLTSAAAGVAPFTIALHGVGCFPDVSRAKVFHAEVDDPEQGLARLARRSRNAATAAGIEVTGERFVPHVTLARRRQPIEASRWMRALVELWTPRWQVDEIALVESRLGQGRQRGPRHRVVERFRLGGA